MDKELYRREALEAKANAIFSRVLLVRPIGYDVVAYVLIMVITIILLFLIFGKYTRRVSVTGQLMPVGGIVRVFAPVPSQVLKRLVKEGDFAEKGEQIFMLSEERRMDSGGRGIFSEDSARIRLRKSSLQNEIASLPSIHLSANVGLLRRIKGIRAEKAKIEEQISSQIQRNILSKKSTERTNELIKSGFISTENGQRATDGLLANEGQLRALERDAISLSTQLSSAEALAVEQSARQRNEIALLQRQLLEVEGELAKTENQRGYSLTAPSSGIVSTVLVVEGQIVNPQTVLLSIVPDNSELHAELFAGSNAIGFVRPGDEVSMRFEAFPYQKFGSAKGFVKTVSKSTISRSEISNFGNVSATIKDEPVYRITVQLRNQAIAANGSTTPLQPGMVLTADISQDTRKLYEWLLEPIYSISRK